MKVSYEPTVGFGDYAEQFCNRSAFQYRFAEMLLAEPGARGRVLDVGCGGGMQPFLAPLTALAAQLDGLDPSPVILGHSDLVERWHAPVERAPFPRDAYDLAYAYNVVEHVPAARPFFEAVRAALKPGGVFWALTPHANHPFCKLSRAIELIGLKKRMAAANPGVNDYPAYYRLNRPRQVLRAVEGLGFDLATFHFMPCAQWGTYFPRPLKVFPRLYDRLLGSRFRPFMLLLAYRLQAG